MEFRIELFAQFHDPDHGRLSVILSGEQITLESESGQRLPLCRDGFHWMAELIRRHDAAVAAASREAGVSSKPGPAC